MLSTRLSLHYHLVFSTKNREPLMPAELCGRIHEYLGGAIRGMNGVAHAVGGTSDHIHVFAGLCATHCLADVMRELKSESSGWIHRELRLPAFHWQEGYGGFTVGASHIEAVKNYVLNQEEHHKTQSFQDEDVAMLRRGLVDYDDRYLW